MTETAIAPSTWLETLEAVDRKSFLSSFFSQSVRPDGRTLSQSRHVRIGKGVLTKHAAGSALVQCGSTQVVAGVTLQIGQPALAPVDCGDVMISCDYDLTLQRWLQRIVANSNTLALQQLCIQPAVAAWRLVISCQVLGNTGNIYDACLLAVIAALLDTKLPTTQFNSRNRTFSILQGSPTTPLVLQSIPIPVSFGIYPNTTIDSSTNIFCIIDPTIQEEPFLGGRLSMVIANNNVANVSWSGHIGLTQQDVAMAAKVAMQRAKELTSIILEKGKKSL